MAAVFQHAIVARLGGVLPLCLVIIALSASNASAERLHKYTVAIDAELTILNVRACFDGAPPPYLVAESLDAPLALMEARVESTRRQIEPSGSLSLKTVPDGGCISYSANVSRPIKQHDRTGGKIQRVGTDLLTSAGLWLWRPDNLGADEDIEIAFLLPDGIAVSAPWAPVFASPGRAVFRIGHGAWDWPVSVAFGRFRERELRVGGALLRLSVLDGSPAADVGKMQAWIADAAQSVADLYGRFPLSRAQILVVPGARSPEPTPWAYVVRGGNPAVHFFVNQRRPIQEFYDDWTAVHELSHLFLPYIGSEDAWISEGVATYYQNVLRARGGRMTAAEAWERLHAGFLRGMDSAQGMTLAQATETMYRGGTHMRVYWEGAAMILIADVRLRQLTAGKQSMDTALAALNECCSSTERAWSGRELFDKLDEITGTTVFRELYDQHVASKDFPDLTQAYRSLGISATGSGIELSPEGREKQLRDAIMETGVLVISELPDR
ncbi:MAG TPA: hypothetical protein VN664_15005 [Burkholderiales bacterium]|jgi:hypothetical protein|nr:hypothetical protein [Burkholderiales bacterium]